MMMTTDVMMTQLVPAARMPMLLLVLLGLGHGHVVKAGIVIPEHVPNVWVRFALHFFCKDISIMS